MSRPATILKGEIRLNVVAAGGRPAATRSLRTKVLLTARGTSFCVRAGPTCAGPTCPKAICAGSIALARHEPAQ